MENQAILNQRLEEFEKQNPHIVEAMQVLNITMDQYLRTLSQLTPNAKVASDTYSGNK